MCLISIFDNHNLLSGKDKLFINIFFLRSVSYQMGIINKYLHKEGTVDSGLLIVCCSCLFYLKVH